MEHQLARIEAKIDTLSLQSASMLKDIAQNSKDLNIHITKTEKLDIKVQKVYTILYIFAGIGLAAAGPTTLKLLKVLF